MQPSGEVIRRTSVLQCANAFGAGCSSSIASPLRYISPLFSPWVQYSTVHPSHLCIILCVSCWVIQERSVPESRWLCGVPSIQAAGRGPARPPLLAKQVFRPTPPALHGSSSSFPPSLFRSRPVFPSLARQRSLDPTMVHGHGHGNGDAQAAAAVNAAAVTRNYSVHPRLGAFLPFFFLINGVAWRGFFSPPRAAVAPSFLRSTCSSNRSRSLWLTHGAAQITARLLV